MLKHNDFSLAPQEEGGIQTGRKYLKEEKCQAKKKYQTEKLLKSSYLSEYQPDFARVILTEPAYSVAEAKDALDRALRGGK